MLPRFQADRGAIKFRLSSHTSHLNPRYPADLHLSHTPSAVFSGAQCMCQGLTSAGGSVPENVPENQVVAIYVEGKEHALAIGTTLMSSYAMSVLPPPLFLFHHHTLSHPSHPTPTATANR